MKLQSLRLERDDVVSSIRRRGGQRFDLEKFTARDGNRLT
jgi:hypothetical protein